MENGIKGDSDDREMGDSDETIEALFRSLGISNDYNPDMDELMKIKVHQVTAQEAADWKSRMDQKFAEWKAGMDDALMAVILTTENTAQVWDAILKWMDENKYHKEDPRLKYFLDRLPPRLRKPAPAAPDSSLRF